MTLIFNKKISLITKWRKTSGKNDNGSISVVSPHVRESGIQNPTFFCYWNRKCWTLESGIQSLESGIQPHILLWNLGLECTTYNVQIYMSVKETRYLNLLISLSNNALVSHSKFCVMSMLPLLNLEIALSAYFGNRLLSTKPRTKRG